MSNSSSNGVVVKHFKTVVNVFTTVLSP